MIILDTNVLIAPPPAWPAGAVLGSSIISLAELQFGIRSSATEEIRRNRVHRLAVWRELMDWILFDEHAAESYGELAARVKRLRPQHARSKDIMIAAQAHSLGIPLMTRNPKDFELIQDVVEILSVAG
ncbi:PIN domain-containing protein [Pseudarthrobacter sulfonivorans]|uniref:PIN domain-containing protein n=1 Tax=Pseudarthrobacter sulfonivorans TaxID=121292 RepID=UPI002857DDFD|nr:PIN domain-containing protein [Pseudarthrobacter sulfonivorans]MDR6414807.1 putative nucleic acid-binding protein [Pseudarthrobacter sulfonivorans]